MNENDFVPDMSEICTDGWKITLQWKLKMYHQEHCVCEGVCRGWDVE